MKSNNYFSERIKRFQAFLKKEKVEGCVIDHPIDLFYLTGLKLSVGRLIVTQKEATLFVDGRYFQVCVEKSFIRVEKSSQEALKKYLKGIKTLAFDSAYTSVDQYDDLHILCSNELKKIPSPLKTIRAIKDAQELKALQKSADLLWKGFLHIRKILKEGVTEEAVSKEFEMYCLKHGATALAFEPIIAFGESSAMPHHRAGGRQLKRGDNVLIDIGVVVQSYHSDMTRVVYFGKKNPQLVAMEKVVGRAHKAALALCRPGVKVKDLDLAAREEMKKAGMEDLFTHSLGHGVGLEIHEFPRIRKDQEGVLEAGMAITIEPGLYLPGVGGIRHEDTILITPKGYINVYD
jgi:Xaa-Pro aminopeptidase